MGRPTRSYLYSIASHMDPLDTASCTHASLPLGSNTVSSNMNYVHSPSEEHSILSDYYHSHFHHHPRSHSRSYLRSINLAEDPSSTDRRPPPISFVDSDYDSEDDPFDPDDPDVVVERVLDPISDRYAVLASEIVGVTRSPNGPESGRVDYEDTRNMAEPMDTDTDDDEENEDEEHGDIDTRVEYGIAFSPAPRQMFESSEITLPTRLDQLPTLSPRLLSVPPSDDSEFPRLGVPYTFSISPC